MTKSLAQLASTRPPTFDLRTPASSSEPAQSAPFRLRDGCSTSIWTAPVGSGLLTSEALSVQTASDGCRRIVWMIKRMIKGHPTEHRCQGKQGSPSDVDPVVDGSGRWGL